MIETECVGNEPLAGKVRRLIFQIGGGLMVTNEKSYVNIEP